MQNDTAEARIGQLIGGRWKLDSVLGLGATAAVYAGTDSSGLRAAVKVLHTEMAARSDVRERFTREATAVSAIQHPGIVNIIDHGSDFDATYIAMELLEGEPLADRLQRASMAMDELLHIVDDVLDVLALAHAEGIVHRDLKPANLFITTEGQTKLLDFGVARFSGVGNPTQAGVTVGTVPYMAPEQALGKRDEIDGRTDIFSLGALMFRVLSGRRIHEADNDGALLMAMASKPAPPLGSVAPRLERPICAVVDLTLGFSREARYPDARTMQRDIRALRAGQSPPYALDALEAAEQATVLGDEMAPTSRATPPAEEDPLVGQLLVERYRIEKLLGAGGMGSVYRAEHVHMRKAVAIKVLHQEMTHNPEVVARFEREAVAAARIEHPNVVAAKDFGRLPDGSFYLALEFIEGRSLRSLLKSVERLPPLRALSITRQIISALEAAHAAGIVHRDLKPENIMLPEGDDGSDWVKVLDFGIAKVTADDAHDKPALTRLGAVFGTPEYMSPEQATGQAVDARSDLYTVGIMLYEMLVGNTPFGGGTMTSVLTRQMTQEAPPLPASAPAPLAQLASSLLAKLREDRAPSAVQVGASLDALIASGTLSETELLSDEAPPLTTISFDQVGGLLKRQVNLLGKRVPVWALGAAALGMLLLTVVFIGSLVLATSGSGQAKVPDKPELEPEVEALVQKVSSGDPVALSKLEARQGARSWAEWRALGRGYSLKGDHVASVRAYSEAIRMEKGVSNDPTVVRDVRKAAGSPKGSEPALTLAATFMGPRGADLLFDVWQKGGKPASEAKRLLDNPVVQASISPALRIAIDLKNAKTCKQYKELLPRAEEDADSRSLSTLKKLTSTRKCGGGGGGLLGGLLGGGGGKDCYACLRGDNQLQDSIKAAETRKGPEI